MCQDQKGFEYWTDSSAFVTQTNGEMSKEGLEKG